MIPSQFHRRHDALHHWHVRWTDKDGLFAAFKHLQDVVAVAAECGGTVHGYQAQ